MEGEKKQNENFYYIYAHFLYINRNIFRMKIIRVFSPSCPSQVCVQQAAFTNK